MNMKITRIILGVYQMVAAIVGLMIVSSQLQTYGLGFAGIVFLFSALSFGAGVAALVSDRLGWRLTLVNQGAQVFGLFSPLITLMISEGLALRISVGIVSTTGSVLDTHLTLGFWARAGADFGVAFMKTLDAFPKYGISVNLVALAVALVCVRALRKKPNQAPEPTPTTATPPAGQEARQP